MLFTVKYWPQKVVSTGTDFDCYAFPSAPGHFIIKLMLRLASVGNPRVTIRRSWFPALAMLFVGLSASATTIEDASNPAYVPGPGAFTGVVQITSTNGLCSGSLVGPSLILTAGHCVSGGSNFQVKFETGSGTFSIRASSPPSTDPLFQQLAAPFTLFQYDVGFLILDGLAPTDASIYPVVTSLNGITTSTRLEIVGYGVGGNPTVGFLDTGTRRRAYNNYGGPVTSVRNVNLPDVPFQMSLFFKAPPLNQIDPVKGVSNSGDSGGPAFLTNPDGSVNGIVGISYFAQIPTPDDPSSGAYQFDVSYASYYESLANDNISAYVTQFLADNAVPEPGYGWPVAACLILFALCRLGTRAVARTHDKRTWL